MSQEQIADDLFEHFTQRLRRLMMDHADTCERIGISVEESMSMIVAGMINEMLVMLCAGGADEDALEEDIVQSCRAHFYAIKQQSQSP